MAQLEGDKVMNIQNSIDIKKEPEFEHGLVENDTVDFRGQRAHKAHTGGWLTAPLIFGAELCERMAAFGITYNLVTYLVGNLHLPKPYSANMVTNMLGTSFLTCLIGGFVADAALGRFLTIVIFCCVQFSGIVLITLFAALPAFQVPGCSPPAVPCEKVHGLDLAILYIALYLIALGTGGIKACVSAFGADQFDPNDPREKKFMISFFNWFFFSITMGALFAVTTLVYVQDKLGRGWGFGITAAFMLVSIFAFLSGRKKYRYSPIKGSPISQIARVIATSFKNRKLSLPADLASLRGSQTGPHGIPHTNQFLFLSKAAIVRDTAAEKSDDLKVENNTVTVTQVEEVKVLIRVLPILGTTFMFWTVYAQMTTFTVEQSAIMNRKLGSTFEIPAASMSVFLHLSILVFLVLYDRVFVRAARTVTGRLQGITTLQRIGVGLVFSFLAMVAAGLVERKRRSTALRLGPDRRLSVFWLFPQYLLVGAGEAFTYVGQLDFFYNESPTSMRSMGSALCLCTLSFGFYFSSIFVDTVDRFTKKGVKGEGWLAEDFNVGHLDRFYFLLAALSFIDFLLYLLVARWYKYRLKQEAIEERALPATQD